MHALDAYTEKAAKRAAEDARQRRVAEIVAGALEGAGIDGSSLTVEEGPCLSLLGNFLGRRFIAIRVESFPCEEDAVPEAWLHAKEGRDR